MHAVPSSTISKHTPVIARPALPAHFRRQCSDRAIQCSQASGCRVEERRGGLRHCQSLRFPSPLIEPDVRISRIRLSDWLRDKAHDRRSSPCRRAPSGASRGLIGVVRLIANHRLVCSFESMPEVRTLPSPGITRLQRYYGPLRLPSGPPCGPRRLGFSPTATGLPRLPATPFQRAVPNTPVDRNGCICRFFPVARGLPRSSGGSASTTSLSRPAQASLALRPAGLLSRPRRPLSQGFDPASYPAEPLVSYQTYRLLSGWIPPPLVLRAIGAHTGLPGHAIPLRSRGGIPAGQ